MDRVETGFDVDGDRCAAWLVRPAGVEQPLPVVVMAHGLGGTRRMGLLPFAERFAEAGYACLVFDYRGFGDSDGEPRQVIDVRAQLRDWRRAVEHARSLPGVDRDRVVLWGSSFSGGHVLAVASDEPGIAAVLSQGPFTDGLASALALGPRSSVRVGLHAVRDLLRAVRGAEPHTIPVAGPPGGAALMTARDAAPGYHALADRAPGSRTDAAARIGLAIMGYRPGRRAVRIDAPLLALLCAHDSVAPSGPARRQLRRAPRADVQVLDLGHFDVYGGDGFETVVGAQLAFLREHVPLPPTSA